MWKLLICLSLTCMSLSKSDITSIFIMKELIMMYVFFLFDLLRKNFQFIVFWLCSWLHRAGHVKSYFVDWYHCRTEFVSMLYLQSFQNRLKLETVSIVSQNKTVCHMEQYQTKFVSSFGFMEVRWILLGSVLDDTLH